MQSTNVVLPDLADQYAITADQIARFQHDGHILLRGVASTVEVAAYRTAIADAVTRYKTETRPLEERDTYGKAFLQVMNLGERDVAVGRFVRAHRFARIAADLMGVEGVRVYLDQALFKEPGGGFTPWHQDQVYWPLDTNNTITMWMPLVDIPPDVGSLTFVSGSHRLDYRGTVRISDESEDVLRQYVERHALPHSTYGAMQAGDATWHAGWTMHRAPGNPTMMMREVMTIIYFADGVRLLEQIHPRQEGDLRHCFPGLKPGDMASGPRTPLVFTRRNREHSP